METSSTNSGHKTPGNSWWMLIPIICIPLLAPPMSSGDYFWHLQTGKHLLETQELPSVDIFQAMTPERAWCTFQWLYEVLLALVEPLMGLGGIRWLHGIVAAGGLLLWTRNLGRGLKLGPAGMALLAGALLFLFTDRIRIRPHVFNLILIGALIPTILNPSRLLKISGKFLAVFLVALLANLHAGGGLIALCLLFATVAGTTLCIGKSTDEKRAAGLLFGISAVVAFLMPGFFQGAVQALRMENTTRTLFLEWQPPPIYLALPAEDLLTRVHHIVLGLTPYLCTGILGIALSARILRHGLYSLLVDERLPHIALALAASILSMRSARFVYFSLLMLPGIHAVNSTWSAPWKSPPHLRHLATVGLALALVLGSFSYRISLLGNFSDAAHAWFESDLVPGVFPVKIAEFIKKEGLEGGVYNISAHHGSYLLGQLWPQIHVHYDGRGNLSEHEANAIAFLVHERTKAQHRDQVVEVYKRSGLPFVLTPPPAFPPGPAPEGFHLLARDDVAELWQVNIFPSP